MVLYAGSTIYELGFTHYVICMATILVTGGAGFIGSHLCERLLDENHRVLCVDNFMTSTHANIEDCLRHSSFRLIEHDIISPLYLEDEHIDQLYNLACPASPVQYQKNPVRTIKANTIGVIHMLGLARAHGATFLQASTSEVYGDPDIHPQPETYLGNVSTIGPRACYDEGKRCAESLCMDYYRMHGMNIKIARIFNTYGPRMAFDDGRVVSNFIVQALKGESLTIYGDGTQTRSFCYVDDLVDGLVRLMNTSKEEQGPINLGNPIEYTMRELATEICTLMSSSIDMVCHPLPKDDPRRRKPDITQAIARLGWEPHVSLSDGLQRTIADFRARL